MSFYLKIVVICSVHSLSLIFILSHHSLSSYWAIRNKLFENNFSFSDFDNIPNFELH